jgi:hypothetical protein
MLPGPLPAPAAVAPTANESPALAGLSRVERTGIEPVTSGLQSQFLLNPLKVAPRGKLPTQQGIQNLHYPEPTGSDRRESDRAVGQAWDETGSIDDDPRSQRGPSDESPTQPEATGDEPSG